ncbi:beta-lactamase family protein [Dactylonectria estremocensis]|uniref:Beta-lactamase family protein n=1 Tax=Dactylonectria estremocensis TaxID=1079267 RepID=A0A9P9I5R3_9HYPO|nr:beta-lactamase family protein [Dactylonectria estremocensis]KAH7112328.1 beta-lactamase family protein [Dactylonectria estremocensis]
MSKMISDQDSRALEGILDEYTSGERKKIAGLVYGAVRNDGDIFFKHASGTTGISSSVKISQDTVFWVASFTKIATSISCMQLVEQGRLGLDDADQLETVAPELRDIKVLERTATGDFRVVEKKNRITLRMLLNHTAGFGYAFEDENLAEYGRPIGLDDFSGERDDTINRPLVNQPGEKFQYGTSMDWVGIVIERITNLSLEDYFQKNIFKLLDMSVSFYPPMQAKKNMAYMHERLPSGLLKHTDHLYRRPLTWKQTGQEKDMFCAGGHGCFGKPVEFLKLIGLLLNDGTDAKTGVQLLRPDTVQEMFKDQIPDKPRFSNKCVPVAKPWLANPTPLEPMPDDHTEGWGLSFSISHFPEKSGRAAGSASWEGLANLFWFADRTNNVGAVIATQILPYGDRHVVECAERLETEIYKMIR